MVADALECVDDERPKLLMVQVNGYLRGAIFWRGRPEVCDRHSEGERSGEFQIERGVAHGDCDVGQRARRHKRDLTGLCDMIVSMSRTALFLLFVRKGISARLVSVGGTSAGPTAGVSGDCIEVQYMCIVYKYT